MAGFYLVETAVVPVGPGIRVGPYEVIAAIGAGGMGEHDVSRDGRRFLMIMEHEQVAAINHVNVVLNWTEELKRMVPPK